MDPAALWAALDLPAPEAMPSQHTTRRVILLGRPLSGKRTVCRRLCFAAEAQYAATTNDNNDNDDRAGGAADNSRQPLYRPSSNDEEDEELFPNHHLGGWNMPGAFSTVGALQARTEAGPHTHAEPLAHGSGVCFDYVVQRVPPTRVARGGGGGGGGCGDGGGSVRGGRGEGGASSSPNSSASRRAPGGGGGSGNTAAPSSGAVRRTTEFFCCDSAGALSTALPTLQDVETAVVLMVVDVSDVSKIRPQLDQCYATLNTYVATLLRNQAPSNDEVRRLQLAAAQQDYWFGEEQKLCTTRTNLARSVAAQKDGKSDVLFKDPLANLEKVNGSIFRVPSSAGTVCTMHNMIVCTKAENLERASRAIGILDGTGGGSDALFARLGISTEVVAALRRSRLSLMALVSQMIRQYAIYRRAAVVSVSYRVNMTTAGADGEYANSTLINPFYKGLWSYISYVLYESSDANSCPSSDVLRVCSARMHPHALLPCGLDAPGLLSHFVTADPAQLAEIFNTSTDSAADSAICTTAESVLTPDGVFALHQKYIQLALGDASVASAHPNVTASNVEEPGMVWDAF